MSTLVCGIDPGFDGAVAVINAGEVHAIRMPTIGTGAAKLIDVWEVVCFVREHTGVPAVPTAIERVSARPGQGVSSMFRFGRGAGQMIGMLQAHGVPWAHPTPRAWQKVLGDVGGGPKGAAVALCKMRWPNFCLTPPRATKPHQGTADALCIAEWMRRELASGRPHVDYDDRHGGNADA